MNREQKNRLYYDCTPRTNLFHCFIPFLLSLRRFAEAAAFYQQKKIKPGFSLFQGSPRQSLSNTGKALTLNKNKSSKEKESH